QPEVDVEQREEQEPEDERQLRLRAHDAPEDAALPHLAEPEPVDREAEEAVAEQDGDHNHRQQRQPGCPLIASHGARSPGKANTRHGAPSRPRSGSGATTSQTFGGRRRSPTRPSTIIMPESSSR